MRLEVEAPEVGELEASLPRENDGEVLTPLPEDVKSDEHVADTGNNQDTVFDSMVDDFGAAVEQVQGDLAKPVRTLGRHESAASCQSCPSSLFDTLTDEEEEASLPTPYGVVVPAVSEMVDVVRDQTAQEVPSSDDDGRQERTPHPT